MTLEHSSTIITQRGGYAKFRQINQDVDLLRIDDHVLITLDEFTFRLEGVFTVYTTDVSEPYEEAKLADPYSIFYNTYIPNPDTFQEQHELSGWDIHIKVLSDKAQLSCDGAVWVLHVIEAQELLKRLVNYGS